MYKNNQLCGCTNQRYRISLTDDPDGTKVEACNVGNGCTFTADGGFYGDCPDIPVRKNGQCANAPEGYH